MERILQLLIISNPLYIVSQDLNTDLLIHYPFNVNGNGYDGTNFGAMYTTDRHGNENSSIYFDGIDDSINMPNPVELKSNLVLN
ncbi:hypothetical protein [Mariniflexile sp. HMF6888]|uniref:hypothetical protein n=1 Tax=Mariniflexile sp. HMF6888 TaxID=3373086 RepID=UPI00379274D7